MQDPQNHPPVRLSVIVPCFNEERTLERCIERVMAIRDVSLSLEIIIVDDCSSDGSHRIGESLAESDPCIRMVRHERNQGKGAAVRTGFREATGDYVAVQDADLEYDPTDLKRLLGPLIRGDADVVLGSRFLFNGEHRVLYFWHAVGNRFLTFVSNMFTDLNLTDMEAGYKVFRRDLIQGIEIKENRFGFEPEIVAKVAHMRVRIFEMGISYRGRTYEEGKKIGVRDGFRALYCILRYNAHRAPVPVQFLLYLFIGGVSALFNLLVFSALFYEGLPLTLAAPLAFIAAAAFNYTLCILILFRHRARWRSFTEVLVYTLVVILAGGLDLAATHFLIVTGSSPITSKTIACSLGLAWNFLGRRFFVFPEPGTGPWCPQEGGRVPSFNKHDKPAV